MVFRSDIVDAPETSAERVLDLFAQKAAEDEAFEAELGLIAEELLLLVPEGLYACGGEFYVPDKEQVEAFLDQDDEVIQKEQVSWMVRQLKFLEGSATGVILDSKIRRPEDCGFDNADHVIASLERLKSAWAGIVDVQITPPDPDEVGDIVRFRYVIAAPKPSEIEFDGSVRDKAKVIAETQ